MKNNRLIGSIVLSVMASIFLAPLLTAPQFAGAVSYITDPQQASLNWEFFNEETFEGWTTTIAPESTVVIPSAYATGYISADGDAPEPEEGWNGGFPDYYGKLYKINEQGERVYFNDSYGALTLESGSYEFDLYYVVVRLTQRESILKKLAQIVAPRAHAQRFPGQYDDAFYLGTMRFTVVVGEVPVVPECCSSVAFFPGLQASRLYSGDNKKRWEPLTSSEGRTLAMNPDGTSVDSSIYTGSAIDTFRVFGINTIGIYESFFSTLDGLVADGAIAEWKAFPYDWRKSVLDVVTEGVQYKDTVVDIAQEIEALAERSDTGTVTLVAHSNGGLVVKALMQKLEAEGKSALVDKIVFVAVPQLGTPDAVKALLHGMNIGFGMVLDAQTARTIAEYMPGVHGLVPSEQYFDAIPDPVISFDSSMQGVGNFIATYGETITTKEGLDAFLTGADGRQKPASIQLSAPNVLPNVLVSQATALHETLDTWMPPQGIELVQVAGWGINTIKGLRYEAKFPCTKLITVGSCAPFVVPEPITTREGDRTVVYPSALYMDGQKNFFNIRSFNSLERKNIDHKNILEAQPVADFISNLIKEGNTSVDFISVDKPVPDNQEETLFVSMHSPASIDVYDTDGKHTGIVGSGDTQTYEEEIPNSFYFELGESKYIGVPKEGATLSIKGTGAGTFTLVVEKREGDAVVETQTFTDVPVTPELTAEYDPTLATPTLAIDSDGNGVVDFSLSPSDEMDPVLFLQMFKKSIVVLKLPVFIERQLLQKIDKLIAIIKKDSTKKQKVIAMIQHYKRSLEGKHWKKTRKLSADQKAVLVVMMNSLLDNIK